MLCVFSATDASTCDIGYMGFLRPPDCSGINSILWI